MHVAALQAARVSGTEALDEIIDANCADDEEQREVGRRYFREHVSFDLDERALEGLKKFYAYARDLQLVRKSTELRFFDSPSV